MILPSIKSTIEQYGLAPKKNLGQNFLLDQNITHKIVHASGLKPGDNVLEIGPGPGGLTRSILAQNPATLTVIEQDSRCINALHELQNIYPQLIIINDDALKIKEEELIEGIKPKIIANLPYNIGTVLLMKWLDKITLWQDFTLMFQKEVADRITAKPATKDFGRLSVICQLLCDTKIHFELPPHVFYPPPKVTSSVMSLYPKEIQPEAEIIHAVQLISRVTFNQRRKMLRATLKQLHPDLSSLINNTSIELTQRPEELSVEQFVQLAENYNLLRND